MYDLLKGLRVVEGAAFIAGPTCALYMAQMGAEVIRFDNIGGGPDFRRWPRAPSGGSLYWEGLNKGKKSVALDLSGPEGRELAVAIATAPGDGAGLFVTNYPASGFLSYEKLKAKREDIICVRVMGWPDEKTAVDYTVNAAIGVPLMTGPADSTEPVDHVLPAWDLLTGAYAAFSMLAAERDRQRSGVGREIRLPLSDIAAATLANMGNVAEVLTGGVDRPRVGNEIFGAFGRDFVCRDGKRLMVVAITPRQWKGLLEVLHIADDVAAIENKHGVTFAADEGVRFEYREELVPLVEAAVAKQDSVPLGEAFDRVGVCWDRYQTVREAVTNDPRFFTGNPIFASQTHPSGQTYPTPGAPATLVGEARGAPPAGSRLGQHTDEVLSTVLGMSSGQIAALHDRGVVAG